MNGIPSVTTGILSPNELAGHRVDQSKQFLSDRRWHNRSITTASSSHYLGNQAN